MDFRANFGVVVEYVCGGCEEVVEGGGAEMCFVGVGDFGEGGPNSGGEEGLEVFVRVCGVGVVLDDGAAGCV